MAAELLPDALWREVEPLLPAHPPQPKGGTAPRSDRDCLRGIIFVLRTGIQWQMLPAEVFGVSGSTCWRRLRDWTAAGVWPAVHLRLVRLLEARGAVDHSIGVIDSASVRALKGGRTPAPTPPTAASGGASGT